MRNLSYGRLAGAIVLTQTPVLQSAARVLAAPKPPTQPEPRDPTSPASQAALAAAEAKRARKAAKRLAGKGAR